MYGLRNLLTPIVQQMKHNIIPYTRGTTELEIGKRLSLLCAGVTIGAITYIPNFMMSDSGTRGAIQIAQIGITASTTFALGGVYGALSGSPILIWIGGLMQLYCFFPIFHIVLIKTGLISKEYFNEKPH